MPRERRKKPLSQKTQALIVFTVLWVIIIVIFLALVYFTFQNKWRVRTDIPKLTYDPEKDTLEKFNSGDVLIVCGQDKIMWATGHCAIVVRFPQYQQLYVWDMPNPLFHSAPTVFKPLRTYLQSALKRTAISMGQTPRIYVHHIEPRERAAILLTPKLLPLIRNLATNASFDLPMIATHVKFCLSTFFGLKPKRESPTTVFSDTDEDDREKKASDSCTDSKKITFAGPQKHTCTSSVLGMLVHCGVLKRQMLTHRRRFQNGKWVRTTQRLNLYPYMLLHPDYDINRYTTNGWKFAPLVELVK